MNFWKVVGTADGNPCLDLARWDAADLVALCLVRLVRGRGLVVVLQPVGGPAMHDLLPEPHQTDEGTQGARDHKAALQAVSQQVLPGGGRTGRGGGRGGVRGGWKEKEKEVQGGDGEEWKVKGGEQEK